MITTTVLRSAHSTDSIYMFCVFNRKDSDCSLTSSNVWFFVTETRFTVRYEPNFEI
jgi:hypothetical protein